MRYKFKLHFTVYIKGSTNQEKYEIKNPPENQDEPDRVKVGNGGSSFLQQIYR